MSGAVLDSRPGSKRLLREPTEAETEFALFRNLICRASVISTIDARKISSVIHGFDERVFLLSKEPDLPEGLFTAVQRFAESEGYGFEVQPPARVLSIDGGKP